MQYYSGKPQCWGYLCKWEAVADRLEMFRVDFFRLVEVLMSGDGGRR